MLKRPDNTSAFQELRVVMTGHDNAGKSSLLGVLTSSDKDNSRGKARLSLLRHQHEILSGRTSSISRQVIGFNAEGEMLNFSTSMTVEGIVENSLDGRIVSFVDTCGHSRYLKTTFAGVSAARPHLVCLVVSAPDFSKDSLSLDVTKDLINLHPSSKLMIIVNKVDKPHHLSKIMEKLQTLFTKQLSLISSPMGAEYWMYDEIPVILTSAVTGQGLSLLSSALKTCPIPRPTNVDSGVKFQIESVYSVPQVGPVVAGILLEGTLTHDQLFIGPVNARGDFRSVEVTSIHRQRVPVSVCLGGEAATLALDFGGEVFSEEGRERSGSISSNEEIFVPGGVRLRRGMVIVSSPIQASMDFTCTLSPAPSETMGTVFVGSVKQRAKVIPEGSYVKVRFFNDAECVFSGDPVSFYADNRLHVGVVSPNENDEVGVVLPNENDTEMDPILMNIGDVNSESTLMKYPLTHVNSHPMEGTCFVAPFVPCPPNVIDQCFEEVLHLSSDDVFADLGCGDGRLCFRALDVCRFAVGVELDPVLVSHISENAVVKVVRDFEEVERGCLLLLERDFFQVDLVGCGVTVMVLYLLPDGLCKLSFLLKTWLDSPRARALVTIGYAIPGWTPVKKVEATVNIYLYQ
jgi:translation elongation factor EF-1alpha